MKGSWTASGVSHARKNALVKHKRAPLTHLQCLDLRDEDDVVASLNGLHDAAIHDRERIIKADGTALKNGVV